MFVGREREMKKLEELYMSGRFEMPVIYGRRRVGKTALITEFCKGKRAIYFQALRASAKTNLEVLSNAVWQTLAPEQNMPAFESAAQLFDYVTAQAMDERLVLVIDEYPYMAENDPPLSSVLQSCIDHHMLQSQLFLILCGSSMSFMENQVLGYKSPLYGRRTAQFKLEPFTFAESRQMLEGFSHEEQAILHGCTGGIPLYLSDVNPQKSMDENIISVFFDPAGRLFEEPVNLLKQELTNPSVHQTLLYACANGASRLTELSQAIGKESAAAAAYVNQLTELEILIKETPAMEKPGRKTIYRLNDSMFRFWYMFVMPAVSMISAGQGEIIYRKKVKGRLNDFMGAVFERMAREYLLKLQTEGRIPILFSSIGRWWGNDPIEKKQTEIDLIADGGSEAIFVECKWRNEKTGAETLEMLAHRAGLFPQKKAYLCLFSKSGFTEECVRRSNELGANLVTFEEMCGGEE